MKPTNSSPVIRSKSTNAFSLLFRASLRNFFLFPSATVLDRRSSFPAFHEKFLTCPLGQVFLAKCSTHVLWLALSPKGEHIDVSGALSGTGRQAESSFASVQAMPPTFKENGISSARPEAAQRPATTSTSSGDAAIKQQPVALEVPVTINGARAVEGSDKREPFSESTKTVLIFGNGAVIRLSSSVAPGQLLFLTNEKTKKEVVCQVVKSKSYRNVSGYVELEFTESVVGFWGMRFPGDRLTSVPRPVAPAPVSVGSTLGSSFTPAPRPVAPISAVPPLNVAPNISPSKPVVPPSLTRDAGPKLSDAKSVTPAAQIPSAP